MAIFDILRSAQKQFAEIRREIDSYPTVFILVRRVGPKFSGIVLSCALSSTMAEKYDVFVGNLTFNTTEDQLREMFSFVGAHQSTPLPAGFY